MKIVKKEFKIYYYNELSEESKNRAINDYIENLLYEIDYEKLDKRTNLYKAIKKSEDLQTPWFVGGYIYDYCKKEILSELKEYYYYEDGRRNYE